MAIKHGRVPSNSIQSHDFLSVSFFFFYVHCLPANLLCDVLGYTIHVCINFFVSLIMFNLTFL